MRKFILTILFTLVLSGSASAVKLQNVDELKKQIENYQSSKKFPVSCQGEIKILSADGITNEIENYYNDYLIQISPENNVITGIDITSTSHGLSRDNIYIPGVNLNASKSKVSLGAKNFQNGDIFIIEHKEEISFISGRHTMYVQLRTDKNEFTFRKQGTCAGLNQLVAQLNDGEKKVLPNEDENKVVPASSGTGFFVSRDGVIVTNNHVVEGCKDIKVNYDNADYDVSIMATDKVNDLALLVSSIAPKSFYPVETNDADLLEEVFVAGFPLGKNVSEAIKVTSGRVSALAGFGDNYSNFQIDAALNQGNSGGPILNKKGNVVGVAVATIDKSKAESFNFGIKSSTLKQFAKSNKINFSSPNRREMDMKKLGNFITDSTIMIECWMTVANIRQLIANQENQKAFYSEYKD